MIVNAPGVLGILFAGVEVAAGGVLIGAAIRGLRARRDGIAWEPFRHLLLLLVLLLATLAAASLLVWAILLQSYVPLWADVRCIVGVLRVGTGSLGPTGWLPALASATSWLRLALLFAAGTGVVLHLAGRDQPEGAIPRRHLAVLLAAGALAVLGGAAEIAYVAIPKTGRFLSSGCCTTLPQGTAAAAPLGAGGEATAAAAYAAAVLHLAGGLLLARRRPGGRGAAGDILRVAGAAAVLVAGLRFAAGVIAPARLGLPLHHCTWCLGAEAPETLVGLALLALPALAAGWRAAAGRLGPGEGPYTEGLRRDLDGAALFGTLGAALLFAAEWVVA